MVIYGLRYKTKEVESKMKSKTYIKNLPKLSDEYATFDSKKGYNKNGIGLGLNICKNLIKLMGM